jgi:hypothetical protein
MRQILFSLALLALAATPALAGYQSNDEVYVDPGGQWAQGSLGAARNSTDSVQYITCDIWAQWGYESVACSAVDRTGHFMWCTTSDPAFVRAVQSIDESSFVQFGGPDTCQWIRVSHGSPYAPKR